ncbi:uncharacterized protein LOC101455210 [Ceratitis capitata]|uniref:uncharacterized protein LOC101455210 n=1 Tax=Ceratitis capitata TaxID=7213 RepID=UPI00032977C2|nr:uncharacterized protein LOC101455210 [Ceratitis capitata]
MKFYLKNCLLIFCMLCSLSETEQSTYVVTNERFEHYPGLRETIFSLAEMKVIGRQRYINGTMKIGEDMASDQFKFQIELYSAPNGDDQFKLLPMGIARTAICEGLKTYFAQILQPSLIHGENTNFPYVPEEGLCPIPKGEYFMRNLLFDTSTWPNQIPRGLLKAKMLIFKNELNVGAGALVMRVEDSE